MSVRVEVCVESVAGAIASEQAGAARVELCSALILGGLTASLGCVTTTVQSIERIGVHVLIRPREGDFVFAPHEIDAMLADIIAIRRETDRTTTEVGFVLGALTSETEIDRTVMSVLIQAAGPYPVSFHRAFDLTPDLDRSLDTLIELGVGRVLTGGGMQRAADGAPALARLVTRANGRIDVMPGGSIRSHNAAHIIAETHARDLHFRAATTRANHISSYRPGVKMTSSKAPNEAVREETSIDAVREMVSIADSLGSPAAAR
ncbi:MAG: copper homeostasis protein CutC [Nakamurella sp.]